MVAGTYDRRLVLLSIANQLGASLSVDLNTYDEREVLLAIKAAASAPRAINVDQYNADLTGATDSTAAIIAARDALPSFTVYGAQQTHTAPSKAYPIGTLRFSSGTYKIGGHTTTTTTTASNVKTSCPATWTLASVTGFSNVYGGEFTVMTSQGWAVIAYTGVSGSTVTGCTWIRGAGEFGGTVPAVTTGAAVILDLGNLGPFVSIEGQGKASTYLSYYGAGSAIRAYNAIKPLDDSGLFSLSAEAGSFSKITIQGGAYATGTGTGTAQQDQYCLQGAKGLHIGDAEGYSFNDLCVQFFQRGQMATPTLSLGASAASGGTLTGGAHSWRVTAVNESGETPISNTVTATPGANGTQVLDWTAVATARSYNVYRDGSYGLVTNIPAGTLTYTDTGAAAVDRGVQQANVTGSTNVQFENYIGWTENCHGKITSRLGDNQVVFTISNTGDISFEYNRLEFKVYAEGNQQGVVLKDGAWYKNGSLQITGNFGTSDAAQFAAALALTNNGTGSVSQILDSTLNIQAEINGGNAFGHTTIFNGSPYANGHTIQQCHGVISFSTQSTAWTGSSFTIDNTALGNNFQFSGVINGDINLHPASSGGSDVPALTVSGAIGYGVAQPWKNSTHIQLGLGLADIFYVTLAQSSDITVANTVPGPARKVVYVSQDENGNWTLTWPKPGSPTLSAPAFYWPGGVAPTQTVTANAIDKYILDTRDGIHWYCQAVANFS